VDLAAQDGHLVAQHDDLDGEIGVTAADESDELDDAAERPVEEREGHGRMLAAPKPRRQSAGRRPRMAFSAPTGSTRVKPAPAVRIKHLLSPPRFDGIASEVKIL
jgi:hypothetical protein